MVQRLRSLVVLLPGIGGSVLSGPDGRPRWETSAGPLAHALIRPGDLDLERAGNLEPTALIESFTTFGPLMNITGYEGLLRHITRGFRDVVHHTYVHGQPVPRDVDVLLVPYDFRRSVTEAAERLAGAVNQALADVPESARSGRVVVVAHSMGGLVARYWIGPLDGWRFCRALLTLGTPHRGAPKALDWLVHGAGVGALRHPGLTRVLRGWPSMYELLPQYPAVWHEALGRPEEVEALPAALLGRRRGLRTYAPVFAARTARARQVHEDIAQAWAQIPPNQVPRVTAYLGRGHATTNLVTLTTTGHLRFAKQDPTWRGNVGWAGDGTVPALSAIPGELSDDPLLWRELPERHGEMAGTPGFVELLRSLNGEAVPTRGGDAGGVTWLGLDVEEVVPAGVPVPVGARTPPDSASAAAVHVTLTAAGRRPTLVFEGQLTACADEWQGMLPDLPSGAYRLVLEAQGLRGAPSVFSRTHLVALDADREADALRATPQDAIYDDAIDVDDLL